MSSTYNDYREVNEELALLKKTAPAAPDDHANWTPPQPAGPVPWLTIGCPGCEYTIRVPGVWAPYRHERSSTWIKVWYFSAVCPHCVTPEGVAEYPFSVFKP